MLTEEQRKLLILQKIHELAPDKLKALEEFIDELESLAAPEKRKNSYAGSWKDIDDSILQEFTGELLYNRRKNKRRFEK